MRGRTTANLLMIILTGMFFSVSSMAQEVPSKPLSNPVYQPMTINPAFVGSKDYTNISLTSRIGIFDSQILSVHRRNFTKAGDYGKMGMGAYAFQEQFETSWNTGLAITGAYHFSLDKERLHNMAGGISLKGLLAVPKTDDDMVPDSATTIFNPNIDVGLYYYGPRGFAGISSTSVLGGEPEDSAATSFSRIKRGYHLYTGYKFLLSRKSKIILEPSVLVSVNDETISEAYKHIIPYLKLYMQNFYLGTYLKDFDIIALFFQYQFPRFYTGVFLEFPRIGYLNDDNIIFELSFGVNLGHSGESFLQYRHW